jgi:hypothetical protein
MPQLSICMPSNRPWARSRGAIESALAFAERTGARLIVSDNSRDLEKRERVQNLSPHLLYHYSPSADASGNWMEALSLADTPFLLPMGDDDELHFDEGETPIDLSSLPADVVGVRPQTQIWTAASGVCQTECFAIDAASPQERLLEFTSKVMGNNSIYYSIYRTSAFVPLFKLFVEAHPTNGGYCDWSMSMSLFTAGRVIHDSSFIYRYDLGAWDTEERIRKSKTSLYERAGLPADTDKFIALLNFLDVHIFTLRRSLALNAAERNEVLLANGRIALSAFLRNVREKPGDYDEVVHYLAELIEAERDIQSIFQLAVLMTDCIKPGLKDGYVRFFQSAQAA